MVEEAVARFGGIDTLVLNAGRSMHVGFEELRDTRIFHGLMAVNYFGYVYATFYALPHLRRSRAPSIVVIGSLSGETGVPLRTAYCGSKFAINGFFEALRCEIGDSVPITIVSPNYVDTEIRRNGFGPEHFRPVKHMMTADEAADIVLHAQELRKRKVVMTLSGRLAVALKPFLPQLVDHVVKRKAGAAPPHSAAPPPPPRALGDSEDPSSPSPSPSSSSSYSTADASTTDPSSNLSPTGANLTSVPVRARL